MRELTATELQAVSGGLMRPAPRPRHPLLRLVVAIVVRLLRGRHPAPVPEKLAA